MAFRDGGAPLITFPALRATIARGAVGPWVALITDPINLSRIPSRNPTIYTAVSAMIPPATVEYVVATDSGFTDIVWSGNNTLVPNGENYKVVATLLDDQETYFVRARAGDGAGTWGPWDAVEFVVDTQAGRAYGEIFMNIGRSISASEDYGSASIYLNQGVVGDVTPWPVDYIFENIGIPLPLSGIAIDYLYLGDVSTNMPTPHIWWLRPNAGRSGDGIEIICFGAGDLQTTFNGVVEMWQGEDGWVGVPVNTWQVYPPTVNAYTEDRTLDKIANIIDMQHQIIEITVPAGAVPPGYSLRIRTTEPEE